jgi:putative transcriptional regulator
MREDGSVDVSSLPGQLLVATPGLGDLNFDRTVVLVLEAGPEGAVGVVLNRPSEIDVGLPLPEWALLAGDPRKIFFGGPVAQGAVLGLARGPLAETAGWAPLLDGLGTLDLRTTPEELDVVVDQLRIFTGYAGWGDGQLENEVDSGAWFVADGRPDDAFTARPERLWADVVHRQGGTAAFTSGDQRHPWLN